MDEPLNTPNNGGPFSVDIKVDPAPMWVPNFGRIAAVSLLNSLVSFASGAIWMRAICKGNERLRMSAAALPDPPPHD